MKSCAAFLLLLCFQMAQAQPEKVKAKLIIGVLGAQIDGDKLAGYDKAGAVLGMAMELKLGEKFSIQPEVVYAQKGARSSNKSPYFAIVRLSYIDLNGVFNYYLKDNIVLQGGIYYGLLFRAKADAGLGFVDALNLYNKTDLGYLAGVEYRFTPKTSANLRFGYSLANISPIIPQYNNIISFTIRVQLGD